MFDYAAVAVEIWHQILFAVIDMPYVLDTLTDRETDHWRNSTKYHDLKIYTASEYQRKTLRLVCRSWRDFADGCKYRWISYNPEEIENDDEMKEAMEAIQSAYHNSRSSNSEGGPSFTSRPRRILFHLNTAVDREIFRMTIDYASTRVTTLFVKCADGWEDEIFEHMISRSSELAMLRCLAIPAPSADCLPLRALSKAFPNLITLTINSPRLKSYKVRDEDQLLLPDLEILGLDVSSLSAASLQNWDLRGMIHLATPMGRYPLESAQTTLAPVRSLGANLTFLNIFRIQHAICLPIEFWTWCPCLVELLAFFSWVYFDTPAPTDHPLKYIVHWPHYDNSDNPLISQSPNITNPAVLHSLQLLPPGVKVFAVWQTWAKYLELLAARNRYSLLERRYILIRMKQICAERSIRVEDQERVTLDEFLGSGGIEAVEESRVMSMVLNQ